MARMRTVGSGCAVIALVAASCGGAAAPPSHPSSTVRPGATTSTSGTRGTTGTPTTAPPGVTVEVSPTATVVAVGVPVTFTVTVHNIGILSVEDVHFGDGGTGGANAGMVPCGQAAPPVTTTPFTHAYAAPGSYRFTVTAGVIGPPPSCASIDATATATVVVAAPASQATLNGAFVSPTANLACNIAVTPVPQVRCASFSPPYLVVMASDGTLTPCAGTGCDLGNPAGNTPVLPYGSATGDGPYLCLSTTDGVTCTVPSGRGFTISRSGVRAVTG